MDFQINQFLPRNAVIVNEGSSTMDIGRTVLMNYYPRTRYGQPNSCFQNLKGDFILQTTWIGFVSYL